MNKLKINFIYNVFYQILAICIPLITTPYASRVLGVEGIGVYSYTYSIAYYFMITAMLGINNFGSREIAKVKDDKIKLSNLFISIYIIQIIASILTIIVYLLYITKIGSEYYIIYMIQLLYILSSLFDINWFYYGVENFKITVTRNSIIKIASVILIIIFVKSKNDVWLYTLILSGSTLFSNLILFVFLKKYITLHHFRLNIYNVKLIVSYIKPITVLFIPVIAMKIYKVLSKTMIGSLSNVVEVGYYSNADGIINVPMGIIIALGTVMLPRISNMISNGDSKDADRLFFKSFRFSLFIAVPIMFGLLSIGKNFSILFLGDGFEKSGIIVQLLSITIVFMTVGNALRTQYMIPNNYDKEYIISVVAGAVINVIFNFILIGKYGSLGATISTIMAEFTVMCFHVYFCNKKIPVVKEIFITNKDIFIKGFTMFICVTLFGFINLDVIYKIIIQIIIGVILYFFMNINYIKNSLVSKN